MAETARKPYKRHIQPHPCAHCGKITQRPKHCSVQCNDAARRRRNGRRPLKQRRAEEYARTHRRCPECEQMFRITRHDNHSKGRQVYCSVQCRTAESKRRRHVRTLIQYERNIYRTWARAAASRARTQARSTCRVCGGAIEVKPWVTRCLRCKEASKRDARKRARNTEAGRIRKRAWRAARKARQRAATVEIFDPIQVLERDKWRCHMCGIKTPKRLRGTYADNAPELDHIVPLATGGEHSRRNTACSCRKCNIEKADKPLGQTRLAA